MASHCNWLLFQAKGLYNEGPAHGAVLQVRHTAVAHARVSAWEQHSVDCCVLTHHTVSNSRAGAAFLPQRLTVHAGGAGICLSTARRRGRLSTVS